MKDEIKEILDRLERIDHKEYIAFEFADSATFDEVARCFEERKKLSNSITNLDEKLDELDTRYRLALMSLVFNTDRSMNEFIEQIDKTIGHKYWNFDYEDDK